MFVRMKMTTMTTMVALAVAFFLHFCGVVQHETSVLFRLLA
jgi:hypothetical protein